jgi:signal transduction histidine kinase
MLMDNKIINWFIPTEFIHGRTNIELARVFVFTHLFGPLIAQPMVIYLYLVSPEITFPLEVMIIGINSFLLLPFVMRWTGNMTISALLSFQGLASISLFGTLYYGGFSSPFLPWLIVSLLLGFFYLSKKALLVLGLFAADIAVFLFFLAWKGLPNTVPIADLRFLGWLSIVAAMVYMSWMALYYARMIALRTELQTEAERFRNTVLELEKARSIAEKISGQRSVFFAKMSHELRTPLNVIIGYSEILLEDCSEKDGLHRQCAKDLSRINSAGKHLLSLVAEVLDSEKIEKDVTSIDVTEFTVGQLCDDVSANAMPLITKNGNRFVLDCPVRDDVLFTDRTKVLQILINLLSNAGKFTNNGTVTLHLSVEKGASDSRLYAYVRDTGIGISSSVLPKLFQDYIQADASISNRFGGTGIGLAITRKFSILLGGEVRVSSKPGEGSCFTLDIPAKLMADQSAADVSGDPVSADAAKDSVHETAHAA